MDDDAKMAAAVKIADVLADVDIDDVPGVVISALNHWSIRRDLAAGRMRESELAAVFYRLAEAAEQQAKSA